MKSLSRIRRLLGAGVVAVVLTMGAAAPARAADNADVTTITVVGGTASARLQLTLTFDKGIPAAEAARLRLSLGAGAAAPAEMSPMYWGDPLFCWGGIDTYDNNGYFSIAYNCGNPRTLPWGFRISPQVRAIIVGNVNEAGLRFWRNGFFASQNAAHTVPSDYQFHGTISPALYWDSIDYQDLFTFRHNVGGGGNGALAIAGSVHLEN